MKTLKNNFKITGKNSFWDKFLGEKRKRVTGYWVTQIVWVLGNGKWNWFCGTCIISNGNNYIFWWHKILSIKSTVTQNY